MKSLKKTLSLVLVLVMVLGMFGIASASSFTDDATVQYKEAVDVMVGIGAIAGFPDGTFGPTKTITRAEAAKMVAYTVLGADIAATLSSSTSSFSDVPVSPSYAWAIPSIEYLVKEGVIAGVGGGKFNPTGEISALEVGKMLLCALGYGAKDEYVGSGWDLQVAIDAAKYGIFAGRAANANTTSKPASREEVALYCFNALGIQMVSYSVLMDQYTPLSHKVGSVDTATTIATQTYPTLLKTDASASGLDIFGRPVSRVWYYKNAPISTTYSATPVATFYTPMTISAIYNAFGLSAATQNATMYTDGVANTTTVPLTKASTTYITGYGATTQLFAVNDAGTMKYSIVTVNNYLAKVDKVTAYKAPTATAAEVDASVDLTVYDSTNRTPLNFLTSGYAKDSYVVVTMTFDGATTYTVRSIAAAGSADAVMTSFTGTGALPTSFVAGGTTYPVATKFTGETAAAMGFKDTYTYYTDATGAVLKTIQKTAAISTDYVYVAKVQYILDPGSLVTAAAAGAKAQVLFTDGTSGIIDLALTNIGTASAPDYTVDKPQTDGSVDANVTLTNVAAANVGNWFAYTKLADGSYVLSAVNADYGAVIAGTTLGKNATTAIVAGKNTTSATVVTAFTASGVKSSFTGFPTTDVILTGNVLYTYAKGSGAVSAIYAVNQADVSGGVTFAYAVEAGGTNALGTEWTFAVNGAQVKYSISGTPPTAGTVYSLTATATGAYTAAALGAGYTTTPTRTVTLADTTFFTTVDSDGLNGATHTYASTFGVFNVSDGATVKGETDILAVGDTVTVITAGGYVVAVYITAEA